MALNFSSDRFNYINELDKSAHISGYNWYNPNGLFIELFGSLLRFNGENSYLFVVVVCGIFFVSINVNLLLRLQVSIIGWTYFLLFLFPLYAVQLRAGVALSLMSYFLFTHSVSALIASFAFHYSPVILLFKYLNKAWVWMLIILGLSIGLYQIAESKYLVYSAIFKDANKEDVFVVFNYRVIVVILILFYYALVGVKNQWIFATLALGVVSYYLFQNFAILSHRISEILFFFVPYVFVKRNKRSLLGIFLWIIILGLGLRYSLINSSLWLEQ